MASSSELWRGGKRKWWISHEGEDGPKGLAAEGDLPECFASIRRETEEAQCAAGGDAAGVGGDGGDFAGHGKRGEKNRSDFGHAWLAA